MTFKDHFSGHAEDYAAARPDYPDSLFAYLASLCAERELVWDCATGNGQAAAGLARYFKRVLATDASAAQIAAARPAAGIEYRVAPAEQAGIAHNSLDLVTVAQALHWFNMPEFFACCEQALRPAGVLAVWSYGPCTIDAEVDAIVGQLYGDTLGEYWPPERRMVEQRYASVEFPLTAVTGVPDFALTLNWTVGQLLAYLRSWSATQRYIAEQSSDPVAGIEGSLHQAWGGALEKAVQWPLTLIVRRK